MREADGGRNSGMRKADANHICPLQQEDGVCCKAITFDNAVWSLVGLSSVRCVHNDTAFVTGIHLDFSCRAVEIALSVLPHCTFTCAQLLIYPVKHANLALVCGGSFSFKEGEG